MGEQAAQPKTQWEIIMTSRHSWSEVYRDHHKTERQCIHCGLLKVSRHETDERGYALHWVEFWRGSDKLGGAATPACERVSESVA